MKSASISVIPNFMPISLVAVPLCDVIPYASLIGNEEGHRLIVYYGWWLRMAVL